MRSSVAAARMARVASTRPVLFPSPRLIIRPEGVRSPLMRPRSTARNVFLRTGVTSVVLMLPSEATMAIMMMNISSPLTMETMTTPRAEASMVMPKERGFFILELGIGN